MIQNTAIQHAPHVEGCLVIRLVHPFRAATKQHSGARKVGLTGNDFPSAIPKEYKKRSWTATFLLLLDDSLARKRRLCSFHMVLCTVRI